MLALQLLFFKDAWNKFDLLVIIYTIVTYLVSVYVNMIPIYDLGLILRSFKFLSLAKRLKLPKQLRVLISVLQ